MSTKAITNQNYVASQDSSVSFESPIVRLEHPLRSICYQVCWESNVKGKMTWQASIFSDPFKWETLVNCEEVTLEIPGDTPFGQDHAIISIPNIWLTVGFLRFIWEPLSDGSSEGNIDVAIRIVPV